nr:NUDIX domain-containing protein [uncultured Flavobacterium sp.]
MKLSAGILLYRITNTEPEFLLVHPGGPFFYKKDEGWWTIPKGEPNTNEDLQHCALREFTEETGYTPQPPLKELQPITQKGGKTVHCWAAEGDLDAGNITCNTFEMEWPPKSGKIKSFPEVDKAGWFTYDEAKKLINERQAAFLDELVLII